MTRINSSKLGCCGLYRLAAAGFLLVNGLWSADLHAQTTFTDTSDVAGIGAQTESYGAAWGDINGDRYPDLFLNNHRLQPSMYLNMGDGTFFDINTDVKPFVNRPTSDQHGGSFADFDNDGDQDLLISLGTGNASQFLVNDFGALIDRTEALNVGFENIGGRMPVWLDYNDDGLLDFVMTQFGGAAKVFRQVDGAFVEATSETSALCLRFQFGMLLDTFGDGRLDFVCPDDASFPQKIYDTSTLPWTDVTSVFPQVPQVADAIIADFDNNGRMDMFLISNVQLRPSSVLQVDDHTIEANFSGGEKGVNFISDGAITVDLDWNKLEEGLGLPRIRIGTSEISPFQIPFVLNPADPNIQGMPESDPAAAPIMRLGFDSAEKRWTMISQTENIFSEAYFVISTSAPVSDVTSTGLWPSDQGGAPTLVMDQGGVYTDASAAAGFTSEIECVSVTAGDFDNDMDVDLYLACRSGAANLENMYLDNNGAGVFTLVAGAGGAPGPVGANVTSGAGKADSVVVADYDVDGFLDLAITNGIGLRPKDFGGPNRLYHNAGNANHWVQFDLVGTTGTREPVGARVTATANGVTQTRVFNGSYHRWSQGSTRMHFGLGSATSVDIAVTWPDGSVENYPGVSADQLYEMTEGAGIQSVIAGNSAPYSCGKPAFDSAVDRGVFVWRDCVNDTWKVRVAAAGQYTNFTGRVISADGFALVEPFSLESTDTFDSTTDPQQLAFVLGVGGAAQDGFELTLVPGSRPCFELDSPSPVATTYGRLNASLPQRFDLLSGGECVGVLPKISVASAGANEADGELEFVFSLNAPQAETITVDAVTADGSAIAGADYSSVGPLTVEFLAGEIEKTVTVPLLDDALGESNETVLMLLSNPIGATLNAISVGGTIFDDEASPCNEPAIDAGSEAGVFIWQDCSAGDWHVRMTSGGSSSVVIYEGSVVSNQAFAGLTPFSNESTDILDNVSDPLVIDFSQRMLNSGVDGFSYIPAGGAGVCFDLSAPGGANVFVGQNKTAVTTPFNPATLGACGGLLPSVSITAGIADESAGQLPLVLSLSESSSANVTVSVQTSDGTATAGLDYSAIAPTIISFAAGETSKQINVPLLDDSLGEGNETFTASLSNAVNATIGSGSSSATITDDELSPCSEPVVDAATEQGVFVWKNCDANTWSMRVAGGGSFIQYEGSLVSTQAFATVSGFSIESSDVLDASSDPLKINYLLKVAGGGRDGIDFGLAETAGACLSVTAPSVSNVFVGAAKTAVSQPFDLNTLGACNELPVEVSISDVFVNEAAGSAVVNVSLSDTATDMVSVELSSNDDSALAGQDFVGTSSFNIQFAPGETSAQVAIAIINDGLAEGDETFELTLSNVQNAALGQSSATVTITDNEFSPCGAPAYDAGSEAGVFIWKECPTDDWKMRVTGGGSFVEYVGTMSSSAAFAEIAGFSIETSDSLDLVTDPSLASFTMKVSSTGADGLDITPAIGSRTCVSIASPAVPTVEVGAARISVPSTFDLHTLAACGSSPQLGAADVNVQEGSTAQFAVYLTEPATTDVSADYTTANGSAFAPSDYVSDSGEVTIPAGMMSIAIGVPTNDDATIEGAETFELRLTNPVGASAGDLTATATIADDDAALLAVTNASNIESGGSMNFTVTLSAANLVPVTVEYATTDIGAQGGADYVAIPPTLLTFNPGQVAKSISVTLLDDTAVEGDESFALNLSNAAGAAIGSGSGIGTIVDNEPTPVLSVGNAVADESAGSLSFTASISVASTNPVSFDVTTSNVSATAGTDYEALNGMAVTIPAGATFTTFEVALLDDSSIESNETFNVAISNVSKASLATPLVTGTINDNESAPTLSIADISVSETASFATFTAVLSSTSSTSVSVNYTTSNGLATAGLDYTAASGTLIFAPGVISQTLEIALLDDDELEYEESFQLLLSNPLNIGLAANTVTATLIDDEALICGEPSYDAGSEALIVIWQDCATGVWHLRTTAGTGFRSYAGNIYSNQGFSDVTGVSVEGGDVLNFPTDPSKTVFTLGMTAPGFDGIDFETGSDATLCLSVSVPQGTSVIAGADRTNVPMSSFNPRTLEACELLPEIFVADIEVDEDAGSAILQVSLSSAQSEVITVDYQPLSATAVAGQDFVAAPAQTLTFAPGETSKQAVVSLLNDSEVEIPETLTVRFDHIVGASFGIARIQRDATVTINDDEVALSLMVSNVSLLETDGTVSIPVSLTLPAAGPVSVDVATNNVTATAGLDYLAITPTTLVFQPGQTTRQVSLTLLDDTLAEGVETLQLQLSNPSGAVISMNNAQVTVNDDEPSPCGVPDYNMASDSGIFIWKDCSTGTWEVRMAAASGFRLYTGVLAADAPMQSVSPVSVESSDVLDAVSDPSRIDFSLRVGSGYEDGFSVQPGANARLCFDLSSPSAPDIYFGADKVAVAAPLYLRDLSLCDAGAP